LTFIEGHNNKKDCLLFINAIIPNLLNCVAFVRSWVDKDFVGKGNRIIKNLCIFYLSDETIA